MDSKIDEFSAWMRDIRNIAPSTARIYRSDVVTFLASGATPEDWVAVGGSESRKRGRRYSLQAWFKFNGVESPEFCTPKPGVDPCQYATPGAVLSLLQIAKRQHSEREYIALLLMYGAGLRLGEVKALRTGDINFDANLMRIRGKGRKIRHVPLLAEVAGPLKSWIDEGRLMYLVGENDDRVMMGNRGGRYDSHTPGAVIKAVLETAGLGKVHSKPLHWLRHMCATHLYEGGWDIAQIQVFLGHENIQTTMIYIHVSTAKMNQMIRVSHPLAGSNDKPQFEVLKVAS